MDPKNVCRISTAIGTLNSVTTKDADTARRIINIIEQLEEIATVGDDLRIDVWRKRLEGSNGR